jgi:glycosyltransferase involved in cell wall biosynthesis
MVTPFGSTALPVVPPAVLPGTDRYVLCVGKLERRKGQDVLVRALGDPRLGSVGLVLAGPDGVGADEVRAEAATLGLADRVQFEGSVGEARLAALYAGASVFALPSRAEGFGLPVLEAMSAGLPVVVSAVEALVDLVGDAGVVVPVDDAGALADALTDVLSSSGRAARLSEAGRRRASTYTWEACASATMAAYNRVAG